MGFSVQMQINRNFRAEYEISKQFTADNSATLHFDIINNNIHVFTYNPLHDTVFCLGIFPSYSHIREYLLENDKESSYTVEWCKRGSTAPIKSYFRATSIEHVLDKFHAGEDHSGCTIYSISLNPIS